MAGYREIAELLQQNYRSGEYPNGQYPSLRKIAADMGCSYVTAVRAMRFLQNKEPIEKKQNFPLVAMISSMWRFSSWHRAIRESVMELGGQLRFVTYSSFIDPVITETLNEKFDLVILDPPKLVDSKNHLENGCRAYSLLARRGFELLNPGGMLLNLSCSGLMTCELFQKITASAANQCGADAVIAAEVRQSPDHPVSLAVPETFYLNGLLSIRRN